MADLTGSYRIPFYCTSATILLSLALVWFAVDERFVAPPKARGRGSILNSLIAVASTPVLLALFFVLMMAQFGVRTVQPIVTLYVQELVGPSMGTLVNYMTEKGVAVLTLNDPPVNAYSFEMLKELDQYILEARFDNDVHVIVLTGSGDKFFSAGANIKMLASVDPTFKYYFCLHANETLLRLEHTPKLVIAALNGHTVGGGLEINSTANFQVRGGGAVVRMLPAA